MRFVLGEESADLLVVVHDAVPDGLRALADDLAEESLEFEALHVGVLAVHVVELLPLLVVQVLLELVDLGVKLDVALERLLEALLSFVVALLVAVVEVAALVRLLSLFLLFHQGHRLGLLLLLLLLVCCCGVALGVGGEGATGVVAVLGAPPRRRSCQAL